MKINFKRSLKFITLLASALMIASVSAATYVYMYVDGSITIGAAKLVWLEGTDSPGDTLISGGTVTLDFDVQPGVEQLFNETLFLKNQDGAADHNLTIAVTNNVNSSTFDTFEIHIYSNATDPSWTLVDNLNGMTADEYSSYIGNTPLTSGDFYKLAFLIKAKTGTSGLAPFDITVTYE